MKFFFKRWVNFEQSYGDVDHLDLVKDKAREWVDRVVVFSEIECDGISNRIEIESKKLDGYFPLGLILNLL